MSVDGALSSWNDGAARQRIVEFVRQVGDPASAGYVPPADRLAVLDNDGTLWCEKPTYVQAFFVLQRVHELAAQRPELGQQQPYQALLGGGLESLARLSLGDIAKVVLEA